MEISYMGKFDTISAKSIQLTDADGVVRIFISVNQETGRAVFQIMGADKSSLSISANSCGAEIIARSASGRELYLVNEGAFGLPKLVIYKKTGIPELRAEYYNDSDKYKFLNHDGSSYFATTQQASEFNNPTSQPVAGHVPATKNDMDPKDTSQR